MCCTVTVCISGRKQPDSVVVHVVVVVVVVVVVAVAVFFNINNVNKVDFTAHAYRHVVTFGDLHNCQ